MDPRDRLLEAGLSLFRERSLDAVLRRIVEVGTEITGARYGALGVLGADGRHLARFLTVGLTPEEEAAIGDPPIGRGLLGVLIEEQAPMRVPRIGAHPGSSGFPANHPPMTSMLGTPIRSGDATILGDLYLTDKDGGVPFTDEDEAAVVTLARQAAVAIENASLYAAAERTALLEDRERIAKDLHDGVIQALFAVGMGLQGAAMLSRDPEIAERIEGSVAEIDRAIRDLRNYIFGLRPGALADRQLDGAIHGLAKEFEERTGVVTVVDVDAYAASELSSAAPDLLQLVREALSNVGRHAGAATCRVSLRRDGDVAILEIDDDGRGFDTATRSTGMGLANLRDRARALGGELTLDAAPGRGTTVRVSIPV